MRNERVAQRPALHPVALALLLACVPQADDRRAMDAVLVPTLLPDGRTIGVSFAPAPSTAVASPEALRHHLETVYWPTGTRSEIESRKNLSDGFAATIVMSRAGAHSERLRETHVVRQLGGAWFRCTARPVIDEAMRDHVLALCRARRR